HLLSLLTPLPHLDLCVSLLPRLPPQAPLFPYTTLFRSRLFGMSIVMVVLGATVALAQLGLGGSFGDDDGSVHEADIEAIAAEGITRGCNPPHNGHFGIQRGVTVANRSQLGLPA